MSSTTPDQPKPLIVAWDLDETIADLMGATERAWASAGHPDVDFHRLPFDFTHNEQTDPLIRSFVLELWSRADFWASLPTTPLYSDFERLTGIGEHVIVTSPWKHAIGPCVDGKQRWINTHAAGARVIYTSAKEHVDADILIDDRLEKLAAALDQAEERGRELLAIMPIHRWNEPNENAARACGIVVAPKVGDVWRVVRAQETRRNVQARYRAARAALR